MNTTADPCDDFFEYTSQSYIDMHHTSNLISDDSVDGGWIENHPLPPGKSSYGVFNDVSEGNNLVVKRILTGPSTIPPKSVDGQVSISRRVIVSEGL